MFSKYIQTTTAIISSKHYCLAAGISRLFEYGNKIIVPGLLLILRLLQSSLLLHLDLHIYQVFANGPTLMAFKLFSECPQKPLQFIVFFLKLRPRHGGTLSWKWEHSLEMVNFWQINFLETLGRGMKTSLLNQFIVWYIFRIRNQIKLSCELQQWRAFGSSWLGEQRPTHVTSQ